MLNADNGATSAIKYEVVKNHALSKVKGVNKFYARVMASSKSLREVADTMVREGCKYEPGEVVAILEKFADVTTRLLQEGHSVNVGSLVHFRPSIRGTFESVDDSFSKADHRLVVTASIGSALRNAVANATVVRVTQVSFPEMSIVYNAITGTPNTLCPDGDLIVMGKRLTWDDEAEDEGFFTIVEGSKVRCEVYSLDKEKTSAFMHSKQFMMEGDEAQLIFSTRNTGNGELATFAYSTPIVYEPAE
jgi:hypothetical protein